MSCLEQNKFESKFADFFRFIFRPLNIFHKQLEVRRLEIKAEAKDILNFTSGT